jgi:hypothetical protein
VTPFDYDIGPGGGKMKVCNFKFTDKKNLMGITFGTSKKNTIHIRKISTRGEAAELYQDRLQLGSLLVCINGQPIDGKYGTNDVQSACKDRPCTLTFGCIPSEDIVWAKDFCKGPKERQLDAEQLDSVRSSLNSIIGRVVEAELEQLRAAEQLRATASEQEEDLQTVECCVCMDTVPKVKAVVCAGEEEHAICLETCFPDYVASLAQQGGDFYSSTNVEWGEKKVGDVMCSLFACVATKCASRPFTHVEVVRALDGRTIVQTIDDVDQIVQVQTIYLAAHNHGSTTSLGLGLMLGRPTAKILH